MGYIKINSERSLCPSTRLWSFFMLKNFHFHLIRSCDFVVHIYYVYLLQ
nr:MAG TPA: hypothetical protein [Bacteriophage sp.]